MSGGPFLFIGAFWCWGGKGGGPGMFWAFFSLGRPGDTDTDPEDKKNLHLLLRIGKMNLVVVAEWGWNEKDDWGPEGVQAYICTYVCIRTCTIKLLRSFPVIVVYTDILLYKVAKKCNLTGITKTLSLSKASRLKLMFWGCVVQIINTGFENTV